MKPIRPQKKRVKIRHPKTRKGLKHRLLFAKISRDEALCLISKYLEKDPSHSVACYLIDLFNIQAEELTETGLSFELVKALAKRGHV